MTSRCSVISLTVLVLGTSTSIPDCKIGAVIIKMISSTSTTSMNGTMLISDSDDCVFPASCGISSTGERLFDLSSDLQRERIEALRQVTNVANEIVVENDGRDRRKQSCCG